MNAKTEPGLLDQMRQVLCDPTGAVVIDGSDDDRATVAAGLEAAAELVEADREYETARREWDYAIVDPEAYSGEEMERVASRFEAAIARRAAALAKFGGA